MSTYTRTDSTLTIQNPRKFLFDLSKSSHGLCPWVLYFVLDEDKGAKAENVIIYVSSSSREMARKAQRRLNHNSSLRLGRLSDGKLYDEAMRDEILGSVGVADKAFGWCIINEDDGSVAYFSSDGREAARSFKRRFNADTRSSLSAPLRIMTDISN